MTAPLSRLAAWSPMAWGLDGFHTVMLRHGGFDAILPDLLKLLTFAALSLIAAVWLNRSNQS